MNKNHIHWILLATVVMLGRSAGANHDVQNAPSTQKESAAAAQGHAMPRPELQLSDALVRLPFDLDPAFPVPVIEMEVAGKGPFRFLVDTGTSGAFVLRRGIVEKLSAREIGYAMVGDASGVGMQRVPLVLIDSARSGGLILRNIMTVAMEPSADHAASIPDDLDGILGMELFRDHLLTIDYPGREIQIQKNPGRHPEATARTFDYSNNAIEISVTLGEEPLEILVDSGHRGTVTLPVSHADRLPLSQPLRAIDSVATVSHTYSRKRSQLDGSLQLADYEVQDLPVVFSDEHTPKLLGNGILRYFMVTIDMRNSLISFTRDGHEPISGVDLHTAGI